MGIGDFMGELFVEASKLPSSLYQDKDVEGLVACLDDPLKESDAVKYLLLLGFTTIEALDRLLSHEDENVRLAAAATYAMLARERTKQPPLLELAVNDVRWEEGTTRAVGPLAQALHDRTNDHREEAARALGWTGDALAVEQLVQALTESQMDIRNAAARALGTMGDMAVGPLIGALKHVEWTVRERAAWVLGEIGNTKTVESLIPALKDEDSDVHLTALGALQKMADKSAEAESAFRDAQLALKCWYCGQHLADPRVSEELKMKRGQASVTVRVQRCKQCEALHRRVTKSSKLFGTLIVIGCSGSCLLTNEIYASATGRSSWIPGIVVGLMVFGLAVGVYFALSFRAHGSAVKTRSAHQSLFPKIQEMVKEGWKAQVSQ